MKILIHLLRDGFPKKVNEEYNAKNLDLEFVDLTYLKTVVLDGTIEKIKNTLTFRGRLASRIEHVCARCLKRVEAPMDRGFEFVYDIEGKEEVDTLEDIREILILDRPLRFLCREDCVGLCLTCGTDLNEEKCACSR